jgi:arginyl-tRNA synthetase
VGNGRGLALGDTLARVLAAAGYEVQREYLVNDAGTQTQIFAATLYARYEQLLGRDVELPEGGYPGEYMLELAQSLREEHGDSLLRPEGEPYPPELHDLGVARMLDLIKEDLAAVGVHYDNWFSERTLYTSGTYEEALALIKERGHVAEREGAVWLVSSALGDEKDNVLVRSTGAPTYFASDVAYHYDKFLRRGFDRVINVWGADHQGHVPRMKAAASALGVDPERLTIIIYQLVTLKRGAEAVRLSKRAGEIITLREVVAEVGADAARFNFVARAAASHVDFDLELAKRQSAENPVYYVQYAHARIAGILSHAAERIGDYADGDVSLLTHEAELALIRKMLHLPELVESIALSLEPHQLPYYAVELATAFHDFYERCRVVSDDVPPPLSKARLKLVAAAQQVLARALGLMGMTAPERM